MLSEHRDEEATTTFLKQAITQNGFPDKVVMNKSGGNNVHRRDFLSNSVVIYNNTVT